MSKITPEACVARGAKWLDKNVPNWADKIVLSDFDITHSNLCICGFVFNAHSDEPVDRADLSRDDLDQIRWSCQTLGTSITEALKDPEIVGTYDDGYGYAWQHFNRIFNRGKHKWTTRMGFDVPDTLPTYEAEKKWYRDTQRLWTAEVEKRQLVAAGA